MSTVIGIDLIDREIRWKIIIIIIGVVEVSVIKCRLSEFLLRF